MTKRPYFAGAPRRLARMPSAVALLLGLGGVVAPTAVCAQEFQPASETTRYLMDTGLLFLGAFAALLAVCGFLLRDIALARPRTAPALCLKGAGGVAVAVLSFWLVGYALAHSVESGGLLGEFRAWRDIDANPASLGVAGGARWCFEMGFAALAVVVVAGAVAERTRVWPFLIFAAVLSGLVFPVVMAWAWSGGYFADVWRFTDHAGAGVLHVTAGASALAAVMVVGPRAGVDPAAPPRAGASAAAPLALVGGFLVLGALMLINAARLGSLSSVNDAMTIASMTVNASIAGAAGLLTSMILAQTVYGRATIAAVVAGAIGGAVSIAGDPVFPALWQAALFGGVGGVIVTAVPPFLHRYRIDDVSGAAAAHLGCGAWSLIVVAWTNRDAWLIGQLAGLLGTALFSFVVSLLIWIALKYTAGVRAAAPDLALTVSAKQKPAPDSAPAPATDNP
ncbi:MAG: hypothetical protein AAGA09_09455 [Pseudomonadota bacterium]